MKSLVQGKIVADMENKPGHGQNCPDTTHNLIGQRLGRKGKATREGILTAAHQIIESSDDASMTLSAVAREMSVTLTTLYLYFPDLGDLVLAVLSRVMDSANAAFIDKLRARWAEHTLRADCREFLAAHYAFWRQHARILQMRNNYADTGDIRFLRYRTQISRPLIELLVLQMDSPAHDVDTPVGYLATVLLTGFERTATVMTNRIFDISIKDHGTTHGLDYIQHLLDAEADMMALVIQRQREIVRHPNGSVQMQIR